MKVNHFISLLLLLCFFTSTEANAQFYVMGQDANGIRWRQIKTADFHLIYPDYYEDMAHRTLTMHEAVKDSIAGSLRSRPRRTPLIVHTGEAISNAYTMFAPQKIDLLTTPPQSNYPQVWMQQLALHEYRHIAQLSKINEGWIKRLSYLFGESVAGAAFGTFLPQWFIEGDAVYAETKYSHTGRGRFPEFNRPLMAQLATHGYYNYSKASLGSYRDHIANVYELGYHIVAYGNQRYGRELWISALEKTSHKPWLITPFNKGLKDISGKNKKGLYLETVNHLGTIWGFEARKAKGVNRSAYKNEKFPFVLPDGSLIFLLSDFNRTERFMLRKPNGEEEILFQPGFLFNDKIAFNGRYISWSEVRRHPRWEFRGNTNLVLFDMEKRRHTTLKMSGRFYAPAVSPDNTQIAVIEQTHEGHQNLVLTDLTGSTLWSLSFPDSLQASTPQWQDEGDKILLELTSPEGKSLAEVTMEDRSLKHLLPYTYSDITDVSPRNEAIYFTGNYQGKEDMYRLTPAGEIVRLTDLSFGGKYPFVHNNTLYFSNYTGNGFRIDSLRLDVGLKSQSVKPGQAVYPLVAGENMDISRLSPQQDTLKYPSSPYNPLKNLFNIHSWGPMYISAGSTVVSPGISIMSQDPLNHLIAMAGFELLPGEGTGRFRTDVTYSALYPHITLGVNSGYRADYYSDSLTPKYRYAYRETNSSLSVSLPLGYTIGKFYAGINPSAAYTFSGTSKGSLTPDSLKLGTFSSLTYGFYGYYYQKQAYRNLGPRFGLTYSGRFRHSLPGDFETGSIYAGSLRVFLPGLLANHSLMGTFSSQHVNAGEYRFSNLIFPARGYTHLPGKEDNYVFRTDYRFPLIYPDLELGSIYFLKRLKSNLFFDYMAETGFVNGRKTMGIDLTAEGHFFRLYAPVELGLRTIYLPDEKIGDPLRFEFLMSVNLYDF